MVDVKDLVARQRNGSDADSVDDQFLIRSYGEFADLHYHRMRYALAFSRFREAFPSAGRASIARAPGRVNLIGEHTDYNGLPVFPIALERDVVVVFSPRSDGRINLVNTCPSYAPRSFDISKRIEPYASGNWGNYLKAAAQTLAKEYPLRLKGMDACLLGDIPSGAGLSSSSAVVVATAIALAASNQLDIDPRDLAELLARGERYVGTEGGGMDHAVSLLAEPGKALKIDFFPLRASAVDLPENYSFVVCNSLVTAEKSNGSKEHFNRRVVECRLGAALLDKLLGTRIARSNGYVTLASFSRLISKDQPDAINILPEKPISLNSAARILGVPLIQLRESALRLKSGELAAEPEGGFKVKQRVRHVMTEAERVVSAAEAMERGDMRRFGQLMNESHASCSIDYEISAPELDALVEICREAGALGSRLTGAGFGGCAISLVEDSNLADFITTVIECYYNSYLQNRMENGRVSAMSVEDAIFPCKPARGASCTL